MCFLTFDLKSYFHDLDLDLVIKVTVINVTLILVNYIFCEPFAKLAPDIALIFPINTISAPD